MKDGTGDCKVFEQPPKEEMENCVVLNEADVMKLSDVNVENMNRMLIMELTNNHLK